MNAMLHYAARMKNSLWSKPSLMRDFAVLSALIVFVLMLVSLWITYVTFLDRARVSVHQLQSEATRIDRQMIIQIEHASYLLESLGHQITQMDTHNLTSIAVLLQSFDTATTQHHVFSWIDEHKQNVVSSNIGVHTQPVDVSDRDFIPHAVADPWKVHIGSPIEGRVSGKHVLPVALGITDRTGKFLGIILISMDIESLTRELENNVKDSGIAFAIYNNNALITKTSPESAGAFAAIFSQRLQSIDFSKQVSGVVQTGKFLDDLTTHLYYERSARYPYTIVLGLGLHSNLGSMREILIPRLLQILLLGLFMLTLLWIVRLHVIKPVDELTHIAAGVLRGQPYRLLSSGGAGEVVALAQEIKYLADYLEEMRRIAEEKDSKNLVLYKSRKNAELANTIKTEFLTAMSHSLRTPLNTIIGFSEIIKNQLYGPLENTQYWQYAQDIHLSAQHLQALIDDVLALSNAEAGIHDWQEKPVDVRVALGKCLRLVTERLQEQKLQVDIRSPEALPRLLIDETRLKQILINLFLHVRRGAEEGQMLVEAFLEKTDHGNEEVLCIAFTSYLPTLPSAKLSGKTRQQDVSALSLPLTKALIAMHQATLESSKVPGKSSTVTIRFPQERIIY